MLLKVTSTTREKSLVGFINFYSLRNHLPSPEKSNIIYYRVLDQKCDDKETLLNIIINDLYVQFMHLTRNRSSFWKETKPHMTDCKCLKILVVMICPGCFLSQGRAVSRILQGGFQIRIIILAKNEVVTMKQKYSYTCIANIFDKSILRGFCPAKIEEALN